LPAINNIPNTRKIANKNLFVADVVEGSQQGATGLFILSKCFEEQALSKIREPVVVREAMRSLQISVSERLSNF
jgi:hypothetical protein